MLKLQQEAPEDLEEASRAAVGSPGAAPRRPKGSPGAPQEPLDGSKTAPRRPKTAPRRPQDRPKTAQGDPRTAQSGPKTPPGRPLGPLGRPWATQDRPDPLGTPPGTPPGPRKCKCWDDLVVKLGPVWGLFETPPDPPKMQMLERFGGQIVSGLGSIRALVFIKIRQPQRRVISSTNQSSSSSLKLAVFKFQSQVPVARRTFTRGLARIPSSIFPGHL